MNIINALKITLLDNGKVNLFYIFLFLFFAIAFIFFFIELQVLLTPETDNFSLYLKIWRIKDWLIVGFLSILVSLNFIFFVYLIKIKSPEIKSTPAGILGTLVGIFSAILATAFCSSCLAVLFSLLGISFSTGIFFLKYKFLIFLLATILLLISLHFQSKRIIEKCQC
jgi:high-affinity Fe2+/Pb2+ permease